MPVFGSTFTDLQQGRLLERDQRARERESFRGFVSQNNAQRSAERLGNRELDLRSQLGNRELTIAEQRAATQDQQFRSALDLDRQAMTADQEIKRRSMDLMGKQFMSEVAMQQAQINMAKELQAAQIKHQNKSLELQGLTGFANLLTAMNQGLGTSHASQVLNNGLAGINRLRNSMVAVINQKNELKKVRDFLNQKLTQDVRNNIDVKPFWPTRGSEQERRNSVVDNSAEWLMNNVPPGLEGEFVISVNGTVELAEDQTIQEIQGLIDQTNQQMNSLLSSNPMSRDQISQAMTEINSLAEDLGIAMPESVSRFGTPPPAADQAPGFGTSSGAVPGTPDINALREQAINAINVQNKDPEAVRARFKSLTGQDL